MELSKAVGARITQLLEERGYTIYRLYKECNVPYSTLFNTVFARCQSCNLSTLHNICSRGFKISLEEFFSSELFNPENLKK